MTVQTAGDKVIMTDADFSTTIEGLTWGVKCREVAGIQFIFIVEKQGDVWVATTALDDAFDTRQGQYDDMLKYIREYLLPRLNAWLKTKFGSGKQLTKFEQVDKLLLGLKITLGSDGTYVASI